MSVQQKQAVKQLCLLKGNINSQAALAIQNRTKSAALIKDLTALIVSSILYYRRVIPPEMFVDKKLGVQKVKILKYNTNHNIADNFCRAMSSVFEAIDLGYLHKMIIIFEENDKSVEIYKLYFEYTGESYKTIMIDQTYSKSKVHLKHQINDLKESIYKIISSFIQTLVTIENVIEEPKVTIELNYNEEITPINYQSKLFEKLNGSREKHRLATQPINFGGVFTPFHGLVLKSQFQPGVNEKAINYLMESTNPMVADQTEKNDDDLNNNLHPSSPEIQDGAGSVAKNGDFTEVENQLVGKALNEDNSIKEEPLSQMASSINVDFTEDLTEGMFDDPAQEGAIRCPCKMKINEGLLVRCENCKTFQHIYCFDMLTEDHIPSKHICEICSTCDSKLKCTVPELSDMRAETKFHRSMFRLILGLSYFHCSKITKDYIVNNLRLSDTYANDLLNRFNELRIIHRAGGTINRRLFERRIVPDYFHSKKHLETERPETPVLFKRSRTSRTFN